MAKLEVLNVFEVLVNSDTQEGKGRDYVLARFFKNADAVAFSKGRDVVGTDGHIKDGQVLAIDGGSGLKFFPIGLESVLVYDGVKTWRRAEAMKKLTAEDKRILGLVD